MEDNSHQLQLAFRFLPSKQEILLIKYEETRKLLTRNVLTSASFLLLLCSSTDAALTPCLIGAVCNGCSSRSSLLGTTVCCSDCSSLGSSVPIGTSPRLCSCNITGGENNQKTSSAHDEADMVQNSTPCLQCAC